MKTLLKKIVDLLDAGGVPISAIEVYPPNDDDDSISVSVTLRPNPENYFNCTDPDCGNCPDSGTCPGSPENDDAPTEGACHSCADDCETCPVKNGDPIKLYTPKEAVLAMLAGKKLRNEAGYEFYWNEETGFSFYVAEDDKSYHTQTFSGLYSEEPHV